VPAENAKDEKIKKIKDSRIFITISYT